MTHVSCATSSAILESPQPSVEISLDQVQLYICSVDEGCTR